MRKKGYVENARLGCQSLGRELASIPDAETNAGIRTLTHGQDVWIGLHDADCNNQFIWSDGSPSVFRNWDDGEPHHVDGENSPENCATMRAGSSGVGSTSPADLTA